MKNILLISFSIIREGECDISYSLGSLLAYVNKNNKGDLNVSHWHFNVNDPDFESNLFNKIDSNNMDKYERIAISDYIWSEKIVKRIMPYIRVKNFNGFFILGGNQITYSSTDELFKEYPDCKIFIVGYGENSLLYSLSIDYNESKHPLILKRKSILQELPSPYLENQLKVKQNQNMVRMETKRGCIYSCNFCAHRELHSSSLKVHDFPLERIFAELDLFNKKKVKKINIIDPIFNYGNNYMIILKYMKDIELKSKISLQTKFELIKGQRGEEFIDLCSHLNVVLEFGLQTISEAECKAINRINKIQHVSNIIKILNKKGIDYEVDLIYGLPNQTIKSFKESITFLKQLNCKKITAHPLMLLKGTKLYYDKNNWGLKEKEVDSPYPVVVKSNSFTEIEWNKMKQLAQNL